MITGLEWLAQHRSHACLCVRGQSLLCTFTHMQAQSQLLQTEPSHPQRASLQSLHSQRSPDCDGAWLANNTILCSLSTSTPTRCTQHSLTLRPQGLGTVGEFGSGSAITGFSYPFRSAHSGATCSTFFSTVGGLHARQGSVRKPAGSCLRPGQKQWKSSATAPLYVEHRLQVSASGDGNDDLAPLNALSCPCSCNPNNNVLLSELQVHSMPQCKVGMNHKL
jgi:hypothetical protein